MAADLDRHAAEVPAASMKTGREKMMMQIFAGKYIVWNFDSSMASVAIG